MRERSVSRRGLLTGAAGLVLGTTVTACGSGELREQAATKPSPAARASLPNGSRTLLGHNRLIGWAGAPHSPALGAFTGDLEQAAKRMRAQLEDYPKDKPILPIVELIATLAHRDPGPDGMFRTRTDQATIRRYLAQARRLRGILLLNIQPGRAKLIDEAKYYESWLRQADVGLALDPEWAVRPGQIPGTSYGHTTGGELDEVAEYLSQLVHANRLPEKPIVYHQVAKSVVTEQQRLRPHPGVAPILSVDGLGIPGDKHKAWDILMAEKPAHVAAGFKLFYDEDTQNGSRLMTPREVMDLHPRPEYVLYE